MMMTTASTSRNAALVVLRRTWIRATVVASDIISSSPVFSVSSTRSFSSSNNNNNGGDNNNNNMMLTQRPRRPSPRMGQYQNQQQQQNRLRRPNPLSRDNSDSSMTSASPSSQYGLRHNAITILPGDFSDSYEPQWHDDDDDWQEDDNDDDDNDDDNEVWSPELSPDGGNSDDEDDDDRAPFKAMDLLTRAFAEKAETAQANRERWIANAQPPVLHSIVDERGRAYGRGGRKTATSRAWIQAGCGQIVVNRLDFINYFIRPYDREHVLQPLVATDTVGLWDVQIMVRGGGLTGQAGAARLAIANALNAYNPLAFRPVLKKLGLLTRDARIVERKKVGHKKARKSPQWVRR
jgi:small subunit ribosomal protein S9